MRYRPHDYQEYATDFILKNPISVLFLDMGLGKTVITLTALSKMKGRVLIIAPLRVAQNTWPDEIEKWDHTKGLTYSVAVGSEKERIAALKKKAFIHIINRENVGWLVDSGLFDFDTVVIDELSSFKSYAAKRFKKLNSVRKQIKRIIGLTGTPTSNGLMDLWAQFKIMDGGKRLGRYISNYRDRYFVPDKRFKHIIYTWRLRPFAEDAIYEKISDITISMKAKDFLRMPGLVVSDISVDMGSKEIYNKMKKDMVLSLNGSEVDAGSAAVLSNKLLQMANGAVYDSLGKPVVVHDAKLDALEDVVESSNGKPVLIAYWFKHDLQRIKDRISGAREIKTPQDVADWNTGMIPVALIHPASAGHGLNLQAGGHALVWFGLTWSLELYNQTNARLWRQGQDATVTIQHIVTKGTIDEAVLRALKTKSVTQDALINAVKAELR